MQSISSKTKQEACIFISKRRELSKLRIRNKTTIRTTNTCNKNSKIHYLKKSL